MMKPQRFRDIVEATLALAQVILERGTNGVLPSVVEVDPGKLQAADAEGWITWSGKYMMPSKKGWILVAKIMSIPVIPTHLYPKVLAKAGGLA